MKTVDKLSLKGKKVFLRVDFNVPLHKGKITSDLRIRQALKTITYILDQKPQQLIIASHLGRPTGWDDSLSMQPVAKRLCRYLNTTVYLHPNILAPLETTNKIVLLENLRFWEGEKKGSVSFAKKIAQHADVYVNDAFATTHRKDASVYALPKQFKDTAVGFLIQHELEEVHLNHKKPIIALFGPAKIRDKLPLLKTILNKVDYVLLGGGVVFTFLRALDAQVGKSLVEEEVVVQAKKILKQHREKIIFPVDFLAAPPSSLQVNSVQRRKKVIIVSVDAIPASLACYDIGPQSLKLFSALIQKSKTVIWNGPLGLFEYAPFDTSTKKLAKELAKDHITTIVCGGDTAAALKKTKYKQDMTHISTGGGASLALLAGKKLPALEVLK